MCVTAVLGGLSAASGLAQAGAAKSASRDARRSADKDIALRTRIYDETMERYKPFYEGGVGAFDALNYMMGLGPAPTIGGLTPEITSEQYEITPAQTMGDPERGGGGITTTPAEMGTRYNVGGQTFDTRDAAQAHAGQIGEEGTPWGGYEVSPMAQYLLNQGVEDIEAGAAARGGLYSGATGEALEGMRRDVITSDVDQFVNRLFGLAGYGSTAAGGQAAAGQNYASGVGSANRYASNAAQNAAYAQGNAFSGMGQDFAGILGYMNAQQNNPMAAYSASTMAPTTSLRPRPRPF